MPAPIDSLLLCLTQEASHRGWPLELAPGPGSNALRSALESLSPQSRFHQTRLDIYSIAIVALPSDTKLPPLDLFTALDKALCQSLSKIDPINIYLWLVLPPLPIQAQGPYRSLAQNLERRSSEITSLVWLPSPEPADWTAEARGFLARTVLACPWRSHDLSPQELSPVHRVLGRPSLPSHWAPILTDGVATGSELVEQLIASLDRPPQV